MPACPNCPSTAVLGTDAAMVCADCASVSVAGASLSLPVILTVTTAAATFVVASNMIRRFQRSPRATPSLT